MSPKSFTPQEKAEIAVAWLEPLRERKSTLGYTDLAKRFGAPDHSDGMIPADRTIRNAIGDAFHDKLVTVEVAEIVPRYHTNPALEHELKNIVWKPGQVESLRFTVVESQQEPSSTQAHIQIGTELGRQILADREFRSGDRIGIGSGRGVYYTVDAMLNCPENRFRERPGQLRETYIMSLMGSVFPHSTRSQRQLLFDSDITASLLARCFDGLVHIRPISLPIAVRADEKDALIRRTWLGTHFEEDPPHYAIVGLGVFSADHRFHQAAVSNRYPPAVLDPILANLRSLATLVDEIVAEYPSYSPVADVCGRMFLVPPPPGFRHRRELEKAEKLVGALNACLVTVTKTQLGKVLQKVIIAAGTEAKARGLFYLLRHHAMRIDHLATDASAARLLIHFAKEVKLPGAP